MRNRVVLGIVSSVLVATGLSVASPTAPGAATCPPDLRAWQTEGSAVPGGEWSASVLQLRGDVGLLRELVIRFGEGGLSAEEARWFDDPQMLEPIGFHTRTWTLMDHELATLCEDLTGEELDALRELSGPRCFVSEDGSKSRITAEFTLDSSDEDAPTTGDIGIAVGGGRAEADAPCVPFSRFKEVVERLEQSTSNNPAAMRIAEIMERIRRFDTTPESGLVAIPQARHVMRMLESLSRKQIPRELPSEFHMTMTAASPLYAEALAVEQMFTGSRQDEPIALVMLAEVATPASVPMLRLKLRASVAENHAAAAGLTLRALLAVDAEIARREALPLLFAEPPIARPALGVFVLIEPELRKELELLETQDPDAITEAARRVLDYLEASAGDETVAAIRAAREIDSGGGNK